MARLAVVLVALLAVGCAAQDSDADRLELGTGTTVFMPIEDGDEIDLVRGAQGGWHIWLSIRAEGLTSDIGSLRIAMQPADESLPEQSETVGIRFDPPDAEGRRSYLGWAAILADPSCTVDETLAIRATFTDPAGAQLHAERDVIIRGGDNPPPPCTQL